MTRTREVSIEKALIEDAKEILELQKLAYVSEAEIIDDFTIPPLHQTIDEIISEFNRRIFLKVELDKKFIGSVRAHLEGGTCHIGKLIVHPNHQNFGIGTRLLHAVEKQFPDSARYELFTGKKSEKNLHIYKKNGYRFCKNQVVSEKINSLSITKLTDCVKTTFHNCFWLKSPRCGSPMRILAVITEPEEVKKILRLHREFTLSSALVQHCMNAIVLTPALRCTAPSGGFPRNFLCVVHGCASAGPRLQRGYPLRAFPCSAGIIKITITHFKK